MKIKQVINLILFLVGAIVFNSKLAISDFMTTSWYGGSFHGKRTASGEIFNKNGLTGAHKKLKFGTRILLINPKNGIKVEIRITDRGPYINGRDLDVSERTAKILNMEGVSRLKTVILN